MNTRCTWGCECDRCAAVRQRWHEAVTLPYDLLLLPASSGAAARIGQSLSPWSMERRAMHHECISAEDELQTLIRVAERDNKEAYVIIEEKRVPTGSHSPSEGVLFSRINRFEISIQQSDNLLEETNE